MTSLLKHIRAFHGDDPKAVTKRKELEIHQLLREAGINYDYQQHVPFAACGLASETQYALADFAILTSWGAILLEVDEDQHRHYDATCDVRRDFDMAASVALGSGHKLVILRYNPDTFKVGDVTCRMPKRERHARLLTLLGRLQAAEPATPFERLFLFYDREPGNGLPTVAQHWNEVTKAVSSIAD